jgi:hypothetical protein
MKTSSVESLAIARELASSRQLTTRSGARTILEKATDWSLTGKSRQLAKELNDADATVFVTKDKGGGLLRQ